MFDFDSLDEAIDAQLPALLGHTMKGRDTKGEENRNQNESSGNDSDASSFASSSQEEEADFVSFPKEFIFGAATAAYQIEGAAQEGGRSRSIWDEFSHRPDTTMGGATGDVACDHYHRFRDDVNLMAHLGLQAYRFSISWSRLIPDGEGAVNPEGAAFYSDLIDALLEKGIQPWVTLYHWDLPLVLQQRMGGWLAPKCKIVQAFAKYARTCFQLFGSRVKRWMTINEPYCVSVLGHGLGTHAPGRFWKPAIEPYVVGHNLLLAHAEAVRIYRTEFAVQGGKIGIVLNVNFRKALDSSSELEQRAAQRCLDFELGWFADPIFKGDYPARMRQTCDQRLPSFTEDERTDLHGSSDFLGINYYFATFVSAPLASSRAGRRMSGGIKAGSSCWADRGVNFEKDPAWECTDMGWSITPWGLHALLNHVHKEYAPPHGIVVTENGCAIEPPKSTALDELVPESLIPKPWNGEALEDFKGDTLFDAQRERFIRCHLSSVHDAITDGADVRGYFVWSLMDNFEWSEGYHRRFGIVRVDYATQRRTLKESARMYAELLRSRGLERPDEFLWFNASFRRPSIQGYSPPTSPCTSPVSRAKMLNAADADADSRLAELRHKFCTT